MEDIDILTPIINSQDLVASQEQISMVDNPNAWGRLYPENPNLKIEGLLNQCYFYTFYLHLKCLFLIQVNKINDWFFIDLVKDSYKAGRQTNDVDFQFTKQCFTLKVMNHISKIHFTITRENIGTLGYIVFISDTSSNGTFLNGEKIGKNCRWILSNNDKIAVVSKTNNGN